VTRADLEAYREAIVRDRLRKSPEKTWDSLLWSWNSCCRDVDGWPAISIERTIKREVYVLPWSAFPASLKEDADGYLRRLADAGIRGSRCHAAAGGRGTPYQMPVKAGSVIAASIGSAMFDPGVFPDPDTFLTRRRTAYLHTGFGPHECLGQYVACTIVPETIRQLLLLPGIRLLDGGASQIDMAGGGI
jgi:hypothetical protein